MEQSAASLPSLLRNQILLVIYTVQNFQFVYIWPLNLNWNTRVALKSGAPTHTLTPYKKMWEGKAPQPPLFRRPCLSIATGHAMQI